jgi:DNA repair ATPase RecN
MCLQTYIQGRIDELTKLRQEHDDLLAYSDALKHVNDCYAMLYSAQEPININSSIVDVKEAFEHLAVTPKEMENRILNKITKQFIIDINNTKNKKIYGIKIN